MDFMQVMRFMQVPNSYFLITKIHHGYPYGGTVDSAGFCCFLYSCRSEFIIMHAVDVIVVTSSCSKAIKFVYDADSEQ